MQYILIVLLLAVTAQADVIRKHKTTLEMIGSKSEIISTQYFTTDKSADETSTKWTKGFMKTIHGSKPVEETQIVRLDKQLIWSVTHKKKTYTEMTFAQFRQMMQQMMQGMEDMQTEQAEEEVSEEVPEDDMDWTVEIKSAKKEKKIKGFLCRNVRIEAHGVSKDNPEEQIWITFDTWNSPEVLGDDEIAAFYQKYLKASGFNETAVTPGLMQAAAFYQEKFSEFFEEAKKAPGETVKQTIEIKLRQLVGPSLGEAIGNAAVEELTKKIPFGFGKKKEKEPRYEERVKYRMTTELIEASVTPVDAVKFNIPEGYKKVEMEAFGDQ